MGLITISEAAAFAPRLGLSCRAVYRAADARRRLEAAELELALASDHHARAYFNAQRWANYAQRDYAYSALPERDRMFYQDHEYSSVLAAAEHMMLREARALRAVQSAIAEYDRARRQCE